MVIWVSSPYILYSWLYILYNVILCMPCPSLSCLSQVIYPILFILDSLSQGTLMQLHGFSVVAMDTNRGYERNSVYPLLALMYCLCVCYVIGDCRCLFWLKIIIMPGKQWVCMPSSKEVPNLIMEGQLSNWYWLCWCGMLPHNTPRLLASYPVPGLWAAFKHNSI